MMHYVYTSCMHISQQNNLCACICNHDNTSKLLMGLESLTDMMCLSPLATYKLFRQPTQHRQCWVGHLVVGDVIEARTTSLLNRGGTLATLFEPAAAHGRGARQVKGPWIGNATLFFPE